MGQPWNEYNNTALFTGVPPYVSILSEMEVLKANMKEQTEKNCTRIVNESDQRHFGGSEFAVTEALEQVR